MLCRTSVPGACSASALLTAASQDTRQSQPVWWKRGHAQHVRHKLTTLTYVTAGCGTGGGRRKPRTRAAGTECQAPVGARGPSQ